MKQTLNLKLKLSEIVYDIQNKTYLTGRSLIKGDNHSHVANMQANDDDENLAQVLRSVTQANAVLRNRLSAYMEGAVESANNESLSIDDDLVLSLQLPSNFNSSVAQTLGDAAHQFLVATAVADWFAITAKGETSDYGIVAAESLKILEETLSKRTRPVRPSK